MDSSSFESRRRSEVISDNYLSTRAELLTVAATMDRIEASETEIGGNDSGDELEGQAAFQYQRLRDAIAILADDRPDRAARLQRLFSLPYDPQWRQTLKVDALATQHSDALESR